MNFLELFKDKKIYHVSDSDADGMGCIILSKFFLEPICKEITYYCTASRELPQFDFKKAKECDIVIFTDITPPDLEFYQKIGKENNIFIFDHHEQKEFLEKLPNVYFTTTSCGTEIYFLELTKTIRIKKSLYQFVELINIFDLFQTDSSLWREAKGLSNLLYATINWPARKMGASDYQTAQKFITTQLQKINSSKDFFFTPAEKDMIRATEEKELRYFKQAKEKLKIRTDSQGKKYGVFSCMSKLSIVSHLILAELGDRVDYIVGYAFWDKNNTKLSLRSRKGGMNMVPIAQKYGGGGHINAAAFDLKEKTKVMDFLEGKFHLN